MREITAKQAARAAGGRVIFGDPEKKICHISLDSRKMEGRDLFVPIVGERVDAHRFICQAISAGAETVFTSCHHSEKEVREAIESQCREHPEWSGQALLSTWICVEDTKAALQALGAWCRSQAQIPLVGITGSVGKTTTREMVACALSAGYRVYKTPGNSNSQVGVPITVFNIPKEAQIGVIELGMSEPGEMTKIAQVAQTDCAVMTNIGVAHIEQLGSKENILKEKLHIQDGMAEDGVLFLNGDDPLLRAAMPNQGRSRILYGLWEGCDCRGENLHLENGFPVFTAVCKEERAAVYSRERGINHIVTGVSQTDFSGYPDCRDAFIKSLNVTLNLAMDEQFVLHTPLMWIDKAQTWALADELGVLEIIRNDTLTCYNGIQGDGCGHCPACKLRRQGLDEYLLSKNKFLRYG